MEFACEGCREPLRSEEKFGKGFVFREHRCVNPVCLKANWYSCVYCRVMPRKNRYSTQGTVRRHCRTCPNVPRSAHAGAQVDNEDREEMLVSFDNTTDPTEAPSQAATVNLPPIPWTSHGIINYEANVRAHDFQQAASLIVLQASLRDPLACHNWELHKRVPCEYYLLFLDIATLAENIGHAD